MFTDLEGARAFYGEVLGWTFREEVTEHGGRVRAYAGGGAAAALVPPVPGRCGGAPQSAWCLHFASPDVEAVARRVRESGGRVVAGRRRPGNPVRPCSPTARTGRSSASGGRTRARASRRGAYPARTAGPRSTRGRRRGPTRSSARSSRSRWSGRRAPVRIRTSRSSGSERPRCSAGGGWARASRRRCGRSSGCTSPSTTSTRRSGGPRPTGARWCPGGGGPVRPVRDARGPAGRGVLAGRCRGHGGVTAADGHRGRPAPGPVPAPGPGPRPRTRTREAPRRGRPDGSPRGVGPAG
ncbi:VOC family protein [Streptomyces somaliensis]